MLNRLTHLFPLSITNLKISLLVLPALLVLSACKVEVDEPDDGGTQVNSKPSITILSPSHQTECVDSDVVVFEAVAEDREDGNISSNISWQSSLDGDLGVGNNVLKSLSIGKHAITASITDNNNQTTVGSIELDVIADASGTVTLSILTPSNNYSSYADQLVDFSADVTGGNNNLKDQIKWRSNINGSLGQGAAVSVTLSIGNHAITATLTDANQTTITQQINVSVIARPVDQPPSVTIQSPSNGSTFRADQSINLVGTASDPEDGNISSGINWLSSRDGALGSGASLAVNLTAGTHTLTASATDTNSQTSLKSVNIEVTAAPTNQAPTVTISSPSNNTTTTSGTALTFTGLANDQEDGNISQTITWISSIDNSLGTGASITRTLSIGQHSITARVKDNGNLVATATINIQVNQSQLPIGAISDTNNATNQVAEYAASNSLVGITVLAVDSNENDTVTYSLTNNAGGLFKIAAQTGVISVANGSTIESTVAASHTIQVQALSSDGSTSNATFTINVLGDGCTVKPSEVSNASYSVSWDLIEDADLTGYKVYYGINAELSASNALGSYMVEPSLIESLFIPSEHSLTTCQQVYLAVSSVGARPESLLSEIQTVIIE